MAFAPVFQRPFSGTFDRHAAAAWYVVAGKTCVAAYQPKGAASLAASYTNLANPGTYDAAPGVAPTWASGTGWTFDGATQYLTTLITSATGSWSILARFSNARTTLPSAGVNIIAGAINVSGGVKRFYVANYQTGNLGVEYGIGSGGVNDGYFRVLPNLASGVLATAGAYGYRNGIVDTVASASNVGSSNAICLGAAGYDGGTTWTTYMYQGNIQAVAIYSATLTAGEVATVSAAMAAL